jgi:hypothetical protein
MALPLLSLAVFAVPGLSGAASASIMKPYAANGVMPTKGASLNSWQAWANIQSATLGSPNAAATVPLAPGCTELSSSLISVVSHGAEGIPAGVQTEALQIVGSCTTAPSPSTLGGGTTAHISAFCPAMTSCVEASASSGYVAVGSTTVAGVTSFLAASYYYTGPFDDFSAHAELGVSDSTCDPGTTVANSDSVLLATDNFVEVIWGPHSSPNYFSGTGWHHTDSGYVDEGTVCNTY